MFGRTTDPAHDSSDYRTVTHDRYAADPRARGGVAAGPVVSGVMVAFGAMFLLLALTGGVLTALGLLDGNVTEGEAIEAGIGAGLAFVVVQFLAYLWGGYTAGRMARGSGAGNGLLVPLTALVLAGVVAAVATGLGATANLNLPFTTNQLPLEEAGLVDFGIGVGIASLVAMFLGGALGGALGTRWHTKLERTVAEERIEERHEVDLRDHAHTPATVGGAAAAARSRTPVHTGSTTTPVDDGVDLSGDAQTRHTSPLRR